jgi:hypothetical protein
MMPSPKQAVRELFNASVLDNSLLYKFNLYDESVTQKLWSTGYYLRSLRGLDVNQYLVYPTTTSGTVSAEEVFLPHPLFDTPRFSYELNRLLDGFFMNSMSTLDTLGHQVYVLYKCQSIPRRIYISTAVEMLSREHTNSRLRGFLDSQLGSQWFAEFESFRHCTTHESLIKFAPIDISYDEITRSYRLLKAIELPDDPQSIPFRYDRNRKAIEYCDGLFSNIQSLIDKAYNDILADIRSNSNAVPVP